MKKYTHIFFDLDRTIWDFDRNSAETIRELYFRYKLDGAIGNPGGFIETYHEINLNLWDLYRKGEISKEVLRVERFRRSFENYGIRDDRLAEDFGREYLAISPTKTILIPHAREILDYLFGRYSLHIITNGFQKTQEIKMGNCDLEKYFSSLTTSEAVGHNKPRPEIFHSALSAVHARKESSIMIGDDLAVDILGARRYGIDQVFFNNDRIRHTEAVTYEIRSLLEIRDLF